MKKPNKEEREKLLKENRKLLKFYLKKRPNIIGLDLGTQTTGFYSKEIEGVAISGGTKNHINHRIVIIKNDLQNLITAPHKSIAIMEAYSFNLASSTLSQLSELGGTIKTLLYESRVPYLTLAPATLKKFVLGSGRGQMQGKEHMLVEVLDRWGIKFSDHNVCDAFCLAKFLETLKEYIDNKEFPKWVKLMFNDFIIKRGIPVV